MKGFHCYYPSSPSFPFRPMSSCKALCEGQETLGFEIRKTELQGPESAQHKARL